jgi:hypothetical protein
MQLILVMLVMALAATLIASPLLWRRGQGGDDRDAAALEAAKEAKFREIRDAEHDFRTGKLSREDFRALDRTLRAEAIQILRQLDAVRGERMPA